MVRITLYLHVPLLPNGPREGLVTALLVDVRARQHVAGRLRAQWEPQHADRRSPHVAGVHGFTTMSLIRRLTIGLCGLEPLCAIGWTTG